MKENCALCALDLVTGVYINDNKLRFNTLYIVSNRLWSGKTVQAAVVKTL